MGDQINFNGRLLAAGHPVIEPANRSFRYGDGIFETMRISKGSILLANLHFARLFRSMNLLQLKSSALTSSYLQSSILELCKANGQETAARVRLTVFRSEAGNDEAGFVIESTNLVDEYSFYEKNLVTGIYPDARKSMDKLSNLKSCNYLPYAMAAMYANQQGWDECLVLNSAGRICDASIANVFWTRKGQIFTPPLSEGCIAGVMREYLITQLAAAGQIVIELHLEKSELLTADEIFLTNAIRGIRPVARLLESAYHSSVSENLFKKLLQPLTGQ